MAQSSNAKGPRNEDPTELYDIIEELGKGSYGAIYKAIYKKEANVVAIKIVPIETDNTQELMDEIQILSECRSPNIVNYIESYKHNGYLWIIMEYCGAGSIGDIMKICNITLNEEQIQIVAREALNGIRYLHQHKLIHRDIKSGNILLNQKGECKLADFGVSAQLQQTISKRDTVIGSPYWMAPEVLMSNKYDNKADIWSLGITLIELAQGKPPLHEMHPLRALVQIPALDPPKLEINNNKKWSQEFETFLSLCLRKNPEERLSADELYKLNWIRKAGRRTILQHLVLNIIPQIEKYRENKRKKLKIEEKKKRIRNW